MCTPVLTSQPSPIVRPPDPSMTVNAPIQVPGPIFGLPTIQAWLLKALSGSSSCGFLMSAIASNVPDEIGESLAQRDFGGPSEHLLGTRDIGLATADVGIPGFEHGLHIGTNDLDKKVSELGDR